MKSTIVTIFIFLFSLNVYSQVDNTLWENNTYYTGSKWQLNLYNFNFMRNYEYFNRHADGLTYFGSILQPTISFNPKKDLSLEAGLFFRKDYGASGIYDEQPTFRINYHPGKWQIIAGQLNGNVSHRMLEPLYNYDRIITNNLEFGNQFLYIDSNLRFDVWINWENMIYKISPVQESVSGGFHIDWDLKKNNTWTLTIPVNFFAYHKGGQIDTPDRTLQTFLNTSLGLEVKYHYNQKEKHFIYADVHALTYNDFSFTKVNPKANGFGIMANLGWKFGHTSVSTTYWNANDFVAVHGAPIYRSTSDQMNNVGYYSTNRNLLFFRLISDYEIYKNFSISARLEPYIDLDDPAFEFSNSLFFTYKDNFSLGK